MSIHPIRRLIPIRATRWLVVFLWLGMVAQGGHAATVLFVADHDDVNDLDGNDSVVDRLEAMGHEVTAVVDDDAMFTDPSGSDLIVISSSVLSSNVGFHFTDEPIPVIHWEEALWDEYFISDAGGRGVDGNSIEVVDTSHPLASLMGLTTLGELVVRDIPTLFHVGNELNLAPDAVVIAEEAGGGSPMIAVVDSGGELNDGSLAPATRIAMFFGDVALDGVNEAGISIFDGAVRYALGLGGSPRLQAGDADMDLDFDQLDLVRVQIAAKYLTGQPATWGEGDWDGAPGGEPGSPPLGNGRFDQLDIIAALSAGKYLIGPYAAIGDHGQIGDEQTSIIYNPETGELGVEAPASTELTSINIDSAADIFTGDPAMNLGGSFDNDADSNIFKATFGSSFGSISFGNVAQRGLSEDVVANDLTVVGSLSGGGDLGPVDLIYVPEPSALVLLGIALIGMLPIRKRRRG